MELTVVNLAAGDCVEDLWKLAVTLFFAKHYNGSDMGINRRKGRELDSRWQEERCRTVPPCSFVFHHLPRFPDVDREKKRIQDKVSIRLTNERIRAS